MIKHTYYLNFLLIVPCSICAHIIARFALPPVLCGYVCYLVVMNESKRWKLWTVIFN
jgi:hypothetical protein